MENYLLFFQRFIKPSLETKFQFQEQRLKINDVSSYGKIYCLIYFLRCLLFFWDNWDDLLIRFLASLSFFGFGIIGHFLPGLLKRFKKGFWSKIQIGMIYCYCEIGLGMHLYFLSFIEDGYLRGLSFLTIMMLMVFTSMVILRSVIDSIVMFILNGMIYIKIYALDYEIGKEFLIKYSAAIILGIFIILIFEEEHRMRFLYYFQKKNQNKMYFRFFQKIGDPILFLSSNLNMIFQNTAFIKRFGDASHSENLKPVFHSIVKEKNFPFESILKEATLMQNDLREKYIEEPMLLQIPIANKKFEVYSVSITIFERSGIGAEQMIIGLLLKNITLPIQYEQEQLKKKFLKLTLTSFSHEIRNCLNGIVGILELIQDEIKPSRKDLINRASASTELLSIILDEIIDFILLENNRFVLNISTFSIEKIFTKLHRLMTLYCSKPHIKIFFEIDQMIPQNITTDQERLFQILCNILTTCIKHTKCGKLTLSAKNIVDQIKFCIVFEGKTLEGFELHNLLNFELYEFSDSIDEVHLSNFKLAISEMIVKQMDSHIEAIPIEGGSEFSFSLTTIQDFQRNDFPEGYTSTIFEIPQERNQDDLIRMNYLKSSETLLEIRNVEEKKEEFKSLTVLIVDDESTNRFVASKLLTYKFKDFVEIKEASNGLEALQVLQQIDLTRGRQLLIFMDIEMPIMSGIEATKKIRQDYGFPQNIKIIILTAYSSSSFLENIGSDLIIGKPLTIQKMDTISNMYCSNFF